MTSQSHSQATNDDKAANTPTINLRQLDCLTSGDCAYLQQYFDKYFPNEAEQCLAIVLTHDCSISGNLLDKEPDLEIVFAKVIGSKKSPLTNGKNPRNLHIQVDGLGGERWIEINICCREFLPKQHFDGQNRPSEWKFSSENKDLIKRWLAARYQAPAYPDAYEARLRPNKLNQKIEKSFSKDIRDSIDGLFMILHPREDELPDDEPYEVELMILTKSDLTNDEATKVEQVRDKLVSLIRQAKESGIHIVGDHDDLTQDEAKELIPIRADDEITVLEYRQFDKVRLDFLSEGQDFEEEPQRPLNK